MRPGEFIIFFVSVVILSVVLFVYAINFDIYKSVENYHPVDGYQEFSASLSDVDFVNQHCPDWATSDSWVLRALGQFLTGEDPDANLSVLSYTGVVLMIGYYYLLAWIPYILLLVICLCRRGKRKGGACNGETQV